MGEKKKRKLLLKLINIAFKVNSLKIRDREITKDLPTVFTEHCGHVAILVFRLYRNGYSDYDYFERMEIKTDDGFCMEDYERIRQWLLEALSESKSKQRNKKLQESEDKNVSV